MNEAAKAWVRALRSGKYVQGKAYLRSRSEKYCCLGVACALYVEEHPGDLSVKLGMKWFYGGFGEELPPVVREWLGLSTNCGHFTKGATKSLAQLNDAGLSFEEIAMLIEQEPPGLFKAGGPSSASGGRVNASTA